MIPEAFSAPMCAKDLRGDLRFNESMASHNSWRAGGVADRFYLPADLEDLQVFIATQPMAEELLWIGLGSNLLVRDGGVRGTVICTCNRLKGIYPVPGGV